MKQAAIKPRIRRSLLLISLNAALWSVGGTFAATPMLLYIGYERWATISYRELVLFAAAVLGAARLFTPMVMRRIGGAKQVAIVASGLAALTLIVLPATLNSADLITVFILFLFFDAIAAVAIWTWIGELTPRRVLGKYLGCREALRLLALAPTVIVAGYLTLIWRNDPRLPSLAIGDYLWPVFVGGLILFAAATLLRFADDIDLSNEQRFPITWRDWMRPISDPQYSRLLLFVAWTAFCTALSLPAQDYFPRYVLELSTLTPFLILAAGLLGQSLVSRRLGQMCDKVGSRMIALFSQLIAAFVPFFFFMASVERPWWIAGSAVALVAQVGLTLALYNLMIKLAPTNERSYFIAVFLTVLALSFAFGRLTGDLLLEALSFHRFRIAGRDLNDYEYLFYIGWITQLMSTILLFGLKEPGAISWRWKPEGVTPMIAPKPARHPLD